MWIHDTCPSLRGARSYFAERHKTRRSEDIIEGGVPSLTVQDDQDEPEPPESFQFLG